MAAQTQVVRFQKDNTGTANATQDVTFDFTPKAIIVYSDGNTSTATTSSHYQWIQGFSDGTNHACFSMVSDNADTPVESGITHRSDSVFCRLLESMSGSIVVQSRATCSFGTNKVTFTWVVNDTAATYIYVWAIGGTDITSAHVGTEQFDTEGGTQDVTGLGFTPVAGKTVLFMLGTYTGDALNGSSNLTSVGIGCATSASNQWAFGNGIYDGSNPSYTNRCFSATNCIRITAYSSTSDRYVASFNSWLSNGFRLNNTTTFSTNYFSYLVVRGGTWDCGSLDSPATGSQSQDVSVSVNSNTIRGIFCGGVGISTQDTTALVGVGSASSTTNRAYVTTVDKHSIGLTESFRRNALDASLHRLFTITAGNILVNNDITAIGTNQFTLYWSTILGGAHRYTWTVVADGVASQEYQRAISETAISVSDSLSRMYIKNRTTSDTISNSDSIIRARGFAKTITDSISNSDSIAPIRSFLKSISDTVTNSDSITTIKDYLRSISDTITNSDSITSIARTRVKSISDSVSNSDSITGAARIIPRSLSDTITNSDSIAIILAYIRAISDTITNSDLLLKRRVVSLSDSITNSDSIAKVRDYIKSLSDSVSSSDLIEVVKTLRHPAAEVADVLQLKVFRPVIQTVSIIDSITIQRGRTRTILDTVSNLDTLVRNQVQRIVSDTITNSDILEKGRAFVRSLSDTVTNSDSLARKVLIVLTDPVSILDAIQRTVLISLSDSVTNSDTLARIIDYVRSISDTITNSDSLALKILRIPSDTISISDSITVLRVHIRSIADSISNSDSITKIKTMYRTTADTVSNLDSIVRMYIKNRFVTDTVSVSDTLSRNKVWRYISSTVTNSDILGKDYFRDITEAAITISDIIQQIRIIVAGGRRGLIDLSRRFGSLR